MIETTKIMSAFEKFYEVQKITNKYYVEYRKKENMFTELKKEYRNLQKKLNIKNKKYYEFEDKYYNCEDFMKEQFEKVMNDTLEKILKYEINMKAIEVVYLMNENVYEFAEIFSKEEIK